MKLANVLRDEFINIYAMTHGLGKGGLYENQILLYKKDPISVNNPLILDAKKSQSVYKLSEIGKKLINEIEIKNAFELRFIAFLDIHIKIKIVPALFDVLSNTFLQQWQSSEPLKYFQKRAEGFLEVFRIYEIKSPIDENLLQIGRSGRNFHFSLRDPFNRKKVSIEIDIKKPVIDDNKYVQLITNLFQQILPWILDFSEENLEFPIIEQISGDTYDEYLKSFQKIGKNLTENQILEKIRNTSVEPRRILVTSDKFYRNPLVALFAKKRANGLCDCCGKPAPFIKIDGEPYLETHHLESLGEGGSDMINNVCAVCPNCHKELHFGQEKEILRIKVKSKLELKASISHKV